MLHIVNDAKLINHYTETHYRFYTQIDLSQYPQVHDFYEIVLVTDGVLQSGEHRSEGLDFLCSASGRSKEHICRTFKQCFGMTPSTYLNRQRLNYAVNLLLHSDYSVTDIGYESGFGSSGRFYHVFHEVYGTSPKKFLQQYDIASYLNR